MKADTMYIITLRLMLCSDWAILAKNSGSQSQHITRIFAMYFFLLCNCDISTKCWEAFFNALLFCCLRWLATEYLHSIMNTTKQFTKMDTIVRKNFFHLNKTFFQVSCLPLAPQRQRRSFTSRKKYISHHCFAYVSTRVRFTRVPRTTYTKPH